MVSSDGISLIDQLVTASTELNAPYFFTPSISFKKNLVKMPLHDCFNYERHHQILFSDMIVSLLFVEYINKPEYNGFNYYSITY